MGRTINENLNFDLGVLKGVLLTIRFSLYLTETDGDNMTFVPLLEGMESNKAFLGTETI